MAKSLFSETQLVGFAQATSGEPWKIIKVFSFHFVLPSVCPLPRCWKATNDKKDYYPLQRWNKVAGYLGKQLKCYKVGGMCVQSHYSYVHSGEGKSRRWAKERQGSTMDSSYETNDLLR